MCLCFLHASKRPGLLNKRRKIEKKKNVRRSNTSLVTPSWLLVCEVLLSPATTKAPSMRCRFTASSRSSSPGLLGAIMVAISTSLPPPPSSSLSNAEAQMQQTSKPSTAQPLNSRISYTATALHIGSHNAITVHPIDGTWGVSWLQNLHSDKTRGNFAKPKP